MLIGKHLASLLMLSARGLAASNGVMTDIGSIVEDLHGETDICRASCSADENSGEEICKFTAKVNLHSGELGYFQFEECGDIDNPTLGLEVGKTYRFLQKDVSNHMHPLGFAYYPDGAHAGKDELEPSILPPGSSSLCDTELTCPAPMYFLNGDYLGMYSHNATIDIAKSSTNYDPSNFGLDDYEPKFFHPITEWIEYGLFSIDLKFDHGDFEQDLFYFCHIHQYMSGRIKLLKDNGPIQLVDLPKLGYDYETTRGHDVTCGTHGLNAFQIPHDECPTKFVCDKEEANDGLKHFAECIESMNCAMMVGMTTSVKGSADEIALFIHQMIPHHRNAVNMAKALIKTNTLVCDNLTDEDSEQATDCLMEVIVRSIITEQNAQIQTMQNILYAKNVAQENDCKVSFSSSPFKRRASRQTGRKTTQVTRGADGNGDICRASCSIDDSGIETCSFTVTVNHHASELGYFMFEECGDMTNPTLGLEVGTQYRFIQKDPSNYMHPLGFAYYPDGAHDNKDELEPVVTPPESTSSCTEDLTCPTPKYHLNDEFLGSDIDSENFGLDEYEAKFFHPLIEWIGYGDFSVDLMFDQDYDKDLFYFCHIHQYMSGRIKLLKDNEPIQQDDLPDLGYEYDEPRGHDTVCGTFGLNAFQLPHAECPQRFVCDAEDESEELQQFAQCINSMNCAMMAGMSSSISGDSDETSLFIHQMIPHHQNAVNMAKALLHTGTLSCDDLTDEEIPDCAMEVILRSIITNQNAQIQAMRGILSSKNMPAQNDCIVEAYVTETSNDDTVGGATTVMQGLNSSPFARSVFSKLIVAATAMTLIVIG